MRRQLRAALPTAALVSCLLLAGCARPMVMYTDEPVAYTNATVRSLLDTAAPQGLAETSVDDADDARHDALVELRSQGGRAAIAADLLTETLGTSTQGVPYSVAWATLDGDPVLIVVEAVGRRGSVLEGRRLWVLAEDGSVLFSAQR